MGSSEQQVQLSESPAQTERAGAALARQLDPGDVVLVRGELGAGKTTLVRGACRALGVKSPVTSPTFSLGNRYPAGNALSVCHLDLYRATAADADLLEDYAGSGRITFIEWPGAALALPEGARLRLQVGLSHAGGERRRIEIT